MSIVLIRKKHLYAQMELGDIILVFAPT